MLSCFHLLPSQQVRPAVPRPGDFALMLGRDAGGGPLDGPADPSSTRPLDYHVEDIPLSVLAGFRTTPRGLDFSRMRPYTSLLPQGIPLDVSTRLSATTRHSPDIPAARVIVS